MEENQARKVKLDVPMFGRLGLRHPVARWASAPYSALCGRAGFFRGFDYVRYARVFTKVWNDEKFQSLGENARLCFLYLLTSPHSNMVGLYSLPSGYACADLLWDSKKFSSAMSELIRDKLVSYDSDKSVVLVWNALKYTPVESSPRHTKGALSRLMEVPKTSLLPEFVRLLADNESWGNDALLSAILEWEPSLQKAIPKASERLANTEAEAETVTEEKTVSGRRPDARTLRVTAGQILEFLNQKSGKEFQKVDAHLQLIMGRLREGATEEQCRQIIARKTREWLRDSKDPEKTSKWLRPKTLFNRTNFENYRGELVSR